jgi:hypothetical protein
MIFKLDVERIDPMPMRSDEKELPSGLLSTRAHIAVASYSMDGARDTILLSADCRTPGEIISWADKMIKELESIKRKAIQMDWNKQKTVDSHPSKP